MKKPEFRKLLAEYAEEISDPENKKVRRPPLLLASMHDDPLPDSRNMRRS